MLTQSQVETVAFRGEDEYEPLCPDCARPAFGALRCSRSEAHLTDDPQRISAYELGEYESSEAEAHVESVAEQHGLDVSAYWRRTGLTEKQFKLLEDAYEEFHYQCPGCGRYYIGNEWSEDPKKPRTPKPGDNNWLW